MYECGPSVGGQVVLNQAPQLCALTFSWSAVMLIIDVMNDLNGEVDSNLRACFCHKSVPLFLPIIRYFYLSCWGLLASFCFSRCFIIMSSVTCKGFCDLP